MEVAAGANHTVGLNLDGTVMAVEELPKACDVGGWTDIIAIAAGFNHTVGLKADGTVVAVGDNHYAQCNLFIWNLKDINSCPNYDTIRALVRDFYLSILDREPDAPGWDFWTKVICDVQKLGIYIGEGFGAMARNYFFSPEYTAKNKTDEEFLTDLYETFYQRSPDPDGFNFWLGQLQCSYRSTILSWFRASTEFKTFMVGKFGADTSRPEKNLLNDIYRGFTHALPDNEGFAFNLPPLQQAQCVSTDPAVKKAAIKDAMYNLAVQFSHRAGYTPTNAEFLADAYDAILARGLDCPGYAFWLGQLNSGYNRDDLLETFVYGTEFDPRAAAAANASCVLP